MLQEEETFQNKQVTNENGGIFRRFFVGKCVCDSEKWKREIQADSLTIKDRCGKILSSVRRNSKNR